MIIKLIVNKPLKPSIKLAPLITNRKHSSTNIEENIWLDIRGIKKGISILLVEQKLTIAFNLSNRLYVMGHGKIVYEGSAQEIKNNNTVIKEWLEVS